MHALAPARPVAGGFNPFRSLLAALMALAAWHDVRQTRRVLRRLTDHELDDIGLTHGDIERMTF